MSTKMATCHSERPAVSRGLCQRCAKGVTQRQPPAGWLTLEQIAVAADVSLAAVMLWRREGRFPNCVKVWRSWYVDPAVVEASKSPRDEALAAFRSACDRVPLAESASEFWRSVAGRTGQAPEAARMYAARHKILPRYASARVGREMVDLETRLQELRAAVEAVRVACVPVPHRCDAMWRDAGHCDSACEQHRRGNTLRAEIVALLPDGKNNA